MSIYIFGDFHGNARNEKFFLEQQHFPEQEKLTIKDTLIIMGDVSILRYFPEQEKKYKQDIENRDFFGKQNYTTFCIMGNHENWYLYNELSEEEKFGGRVKVLETNYKPIYFAITGEIYTIEGKTFLVINGALSIDKELRTKGIDWFEEETLSNKEINKILDVIEKEKEVDYLLSHTVNSKIVNYFTKNNNDYGNNLKYKCHTSEFLSYVDEILKYKENHFGHFHIQKEIKIDNKKYICHYKSKPYKLI